VITASPEAFRQALRHLPLPADLPPTMRSALLVSPMGFRLVNRSSPDNLYVDWDAEVDADRALRQHAELVRTLEEVGVPVRVLPGVPELPDGVFPNNAFATVPQRLVVGSMRHPLRRGETRRPEVWAYFRDELGYEIWDLEGDEVVAEMTGPLVLDRARGIGYCGMTERVNEAGVRAMHEALGLRLTFAFPLDPGEYHTNVVMAVLAGRALVLHPPSLADPEVARALLTFYGDDALVLDDREKADFAGNCIAATPDHVLMSARALDALRPSSRAFLEARGFTLHGVDVSELEKAGGSLRCMVAEVF
jgi:N-dimethylarginine dimethylaminohydrolase